jgi:ethanolamine ammonia-lyase small subunit
MAMSDDVDPTVVTNPWGGLKQFTPARIALGRTGISLSTRVGLDFQLAHALARDAVNIPVDFTELEQRLLFMGYQSLTLKTRAENQQMYLQRPDLGRLLSESAVDSLQKSATNTADGVIVVADGLSSKAIEQHAEPFLSRLLPVLKENGYVLPPICFVKHGRVAIGDAIAELCSARLCIVLIGERPGLSSPDSMGIYFTYQARSGITTDADRNCISNIHKNGLSYQLALNKLLFLITEAEKLKLSGVNLKDQTTEFISNSKQEKGNFLLD